MKASFCAATAKETFGNELPGLQDGTQIPAAVKSLLAARRWVCRREGADHRTVGCMLFHRDLARIKSRAHITYHSCLQIKCVIPVGVIPSLHYPRVIWCYSAKAVLQWKVGQALLIFLFVWYKMSCFWSCYKNALEKKKKDGSIHFERPFHTESYGVSKLSMGR